jgi:hypothetical protein
MFRFLRQAMTLCVAAVLASCSDGNPTQPSMADQAVEYSSRTTASLIVAAPWSATFSPSPGALVTSDGSVSNPSMHYDRSGIGLFNGTWRFTTATTEAGTVTLRYHWTGFHSYFQATASIRGYLRRSGGDVYPTGVLQSGGVSGGFEWTGMTTFSVIAGDEYGFEISGSHFDSALQLSGDLTVVPQFVPLPHPPVVTLMAASGAEGSPVAFVASASDPDNNITAYAWDFGDGGTSSAGSAVSHTYAQDGTYAVRVTVTDATGLSATALSTAVIANVAPSVSALPSTSILSGGTYSAAGNFTDPGADVWSASVDYGDGTGTSPVALAGKAFSLSHAYLTAGTFTVTVNVSDGSGTAQRTATVVVQAPPPPPPSNNPTTKDQCMKDGWKVFGFKNQGLCIQYVNTGKDSRP